MNEIKPGDHPRGGPNGNNFHRDHGPYWRRAHRDWRFWVASIMTLAAILIYIMSDQLAGWPPHQSPPVSGLIEK